MKCFFVERFNVDFRLGFEESATIAEAKQRSEMEQIVSQAVGPMAEQIMALPVAVAVVVARLLARPVATASKRLL